MQSTGRKKLFQAQPQPDLDEPPDYPFEPPDEFHQADDADEAAEVDLTELIETDLAHFFGSQGPLAQRLTGYELRPSQLAMAEAIKRTLLSQGNALIEAPTGTGKSIAYLVPAILSGKTVIVATANKSLQSQLYYKDIPFLREVMGLPITAVIVKGRSNFVCNLKWDKELVEQQRMSLFDREHDQIKFMRPWLKETDTGDVDDLPFLLDSDLRPRLVSYPDDCLHSDCHYYHENCWVNHMRDKAAEAQVLITNHHLLLNALELGWAGERILPPAGVYIIDEAHGLEQTATAVYETTVTDYTVEQLLSRKLYAEHLGEEPVEDLKMQNILAFQEIAHLSRDNAYRVEVELEELKKLGTALNKAAERMKQLNPFKKKSDSTSDLPEDSQLPPSAGTGRGGGQADDEPSEERKLFELAIEALGSTATKLLTVATSKHDGDMVRYAQRVFERRHTTLEVHAAPINPASLLRQYLFHPEDEEGNARARTVICTSATLTTNGNFTHFKARCGLEQVGEEQVLPPVFDYPRQALLYQPALPAYDYRNADPYYNAVASEIERLLEVSRGRSLCLFTSWSGLQQVRERLAAADKRLIWPMRAQGDAPRDALLAWFKSTPYSVLLATRSFWEGVDIPGDNLSLVVLDKMPFPTPGDPLHSARMTAIDSGGGNSFGSYMTPLMTLALKQGFGRLIRRASDRGVVAILDERLSSKSYGRQARNDLPAARFSRDFKDVHKFFQSALESKAEFALNVWVEGDEVANPARAARRRGADLEVGNEESDDKLSTTIHNSQFTIRNWHWQALRLQDGKADRQSGPVDNLADAVAAEIHAATLGLRDLRQRIERAGRQASQFGVEVRCSAAAGQVLESGAGDKKVVQPWAQERSLWQWVQVVGVGAAEEQS